jgi:hypothetical protein
MAERFDVKAAFATLSSDEQRAIGEAGLLLAYLIDVKEWFDDRPAPAFDAAEGEAYEVLLGAVRAAAIPAFDTEPPVVPDLKSFGVAQCRECGCTDAGAGGGSWVAEDLCLRCAAGAH